MITVIIAGGSGTRLWPLSTPDYPKHLLALTGRKPLVCYAYERAKAMSEAIYIVTDGSHAHYVKDAIPELSEDAFIVEPARRGTASCIVAALKHIVERHGEDEPIAFIPADHYVRDTNGFTHSFRIAAKISEKTNQVVLIGVEPDYPATGFGYIQKDGLYDEDSFTFRVDSFKEKPDYKTAQKYFSSGEYLWNCGYFIASAKTFLKNMKTYAPNMYSSYVKLLKTKSPKEFEKTYLEFENISVDYALIEKMQDLLVVRAAFDWMDLGSYGDLHKAVESDDVGNHTYGENVQLEDVENSYVRNEEDKPVAVIGLDNVAVVNTPKGLLVTRKDLAQKVGDVSKRFKKK